MSNHLSKKNIPEIAVKARKHLEKVLQNDYVSKMVANAYDAIVSDDIENENELERQKEDLIKNSTMTMKIPQEMKDLINNCNGMKADEFYKKMDEIAMKNGA